MPITLCEVEYLKYLNKIVALAKEQTVQQIARRIEQEMLSIVTQKTA